MVVSIRDGAPVVNVKDHVAYAHVEPYSSLIRELPESTVERIYEEVQEDFWEVIAPQIAEDYGYDRTVYGAGRSSGWLQPTGKGLGFLEYLDLWSGTDDANDNAPAVALIQRTRFLAFAGAIDAAVEGAREMFEQRLKEAVEELNARREAAIVRGEN
jgi:hypothetical protein